jgi:O-antigen ligase
MNTGAARYAMSDPNAFIGYENYFAKAVFELGLPGLVLVVSLFLSIIAAGYMSTKRIQLPALRCSASSLLVFFIIMFANSFKRWQIDLDPVNVYYWLFAGLMLKLPILDSLTGEQAADSGVGAVPAVALPALTASAL